MLLRSERDLALFLLRRRKELSLTQQQVADRARVRRATVADLERGTSHASFATAVALLGALEVDLDAVARSAPSKQQPETVAGPKRRPPVDLDALLARVREDA